MRKTEANLFIIESLSFDDEQKNRYEGRLLSQILHLGGKESAYCYIQTEDELKKTLRLFEVSKYRYLHLSCHGNENSIYTTLDEIPFLKLGKLLKSYLRNKRLFISACSIVSDDLAKAVIPLSGCRSIMGPTIDILYSDAAIIWASFYHLVFTKDPLRMKKRGILSAMRAVVETFGVPVDLYSKSKRAKKGYMRTRIRRKSKMSRERASKKKS